MQDEALLQRIRQILKRSRGEPSKFMEFIECIGSMKKEGETASYPRIVRRMWPQDWQETQNKVEFELTKWDLLCKRRREINRRLFSSPMRFQFFIELSPEKEFKILTDPEDIHTKRRKELEWNLARETSKSRKEKILAEIAELSSRFQKLGIGDVQEITETTGEEETHLKGTEKTGRGIWAARKRWLVPTLAASLVILAVSITITYLLSRRAPATVTSVQTPGLALPDKPSIAVLPFVNMSDDREQEFFADGITEEIITSLSKIPDLFVIARNSTFTYKGKPVSVEQVSEELGVRYVLEGSVRWEGDKVRITAQLIDAVQGHHIWAERFERELKEIFAIQDELTLKIMTSVLGVTVASEETSQILARGANNLEAYLKYMEGVTFFRRLNRDDIALAGRKFEEAIALDPQWAVPYASLSHVKALEFRFSQNPESLKKAYECAQKAISLDERGAPGYIALEHVCIMQKRHEDAIAAAEKAVEVAPGFAYAYLFLGDALLYAGRAEEALVYLEKALRMDPMPPPVVFGEISAAHFILGNYEESISAGKKALSISPKWQTQRAGQIACYVEMGKMDEARAEAEELLRIDPKFTISGYEKIAAWKDSRVTERLVEAWRKVGLDRKATAN